MNTYLVCFERGPGQLIKASRYEIVGGFVEFYADDTVVLTAKQVVAIVVAK